MFNVILRILSLTILVIRWWYWKKEERKAEREKPKTSTIALYNNVSRIIFLIMYYGMILQVIGLPVLSFSHFSLGFALVGLSILVWGVLIGIIARRRLGNNWTNGYEYQVKDKHSLVTTGIYSLIRHPIYTSLALVFIGGEMIAQSYLWISAFAFFVVAYAQGRREEKILLAHFGNEYKEYMTHTKMLIPFVL